MACNFVSDAITYISCRQFSYLSQYITKSYLKVRLCPIQLPTFASLPLLQELKEIM